MSVLESILESDLKSTLQFVLKFVMFEKILKKITVSQNSCQAQLLEVDMTQIPGDH